MLVNNKNPKKKIITKLLFALFLVFTLIITLFSPFNFLKLKKGPLKEAIENLEPKYANAHYQYSPALQTIIYGKSKTNDFRSLGTSDGTRWEIGTVAQGLDTVLSFRAVNPRSANKIIVSYRGLTSTTTLNYQIQICDYVNSPGDTNGVACNEGGGIWRNIVDHGSTDQTSALNLNSDRSYVFHIFNGYFSDASGNTPKSTPISDFINNGEMKLRFYSTTTATDLMLYLDFLQIEVVVDNLYLAGAVDIGNEAVSAGQYTDTYFQDVARAGTCSTNQCLQIANSGDGLNATFKFKNVAAPYQGANTILIYEYGYVTANTYYIDICSSFDASPSCLAWDTLNSTPFSNTTAIYHTVARAGITPSNYINNLNEMWVRIRMPNNSGNYRMDYISATIGSTNINSGQSEISLGSNSVNDSTYTASLDNSTTTATTTMWIVNSALATTSALTSTMYSDDAVGTLASEYGVAANVSVPITPPSNSLVTEVIWAARWSMVGGTTITTASSLRTYSRQWRQQVAETIAVDNNQTFQMGVYGACTPCTEAATAEGVTSIAYGPIPRDHSSTADTAAAGWMEGPAVAIAPVAASGNETAVSPWESIDPVTNSANIRIRTTDSTRTTAGINLYWDFAFVSIRYIDGIYPTAKARVTAQNGGVVSGLNATSNWRFTMDSVAGSVVSPSWAISDNGGVADAWLEFSTTTLPSSANKLILTNRIAASVDASNTIFMICDFATSTGVYGTSTQCNSPGGWRVLNHVSGGYPYDYSAANALNLFQFEIYNGYFGTSTTPYYTPLSNFFNNGVARIRLLENGGSNIYFYWKFSQLEVATDNFYSPASYQAFTAATSSGSYTDAYLPDTCTAPYRCFSVAASSNNINYYLKFNNIATPYTGANALYVDTTIRTSAAATVPFSVRICNFTKAGGDCTADNGWENLNSQQLYPSNTLTRYQFIKKINNWSDYINSYNEIWISYFGIHTAAFNLDLDYSQIAIGSVAEDISKSDVSYGTSYLGNALLTADADNSVLFWDQKNCWIVNSYSQTNRSGDLMASVSAGIMVSAGLPERALPTALRWAAQSWQGGGFTAQAKFKNFSGDYDVAVNSSRLMTTVAGVASYDATARTDSSFAITDLPLRGVYIINPEDYIDTVNNQIGFRWVTSAAVATAEQQLYWDYTFITMRYLIPDATLNNSYRWYENVDNITPTSTLASENQQIKDSSPGAVYRLRVNLLASVASIATSTKIKLQYSENMMTMWYDVGATSSSAAWRFYDNNSITGGVTLPSALLSDSNVAESYEESNPSTSTPNNINSYQKGEFDFAIQNNNAKSNATYFFRIVRSDGFVYDSFNNYPKAVTSNMFTIGDGVLVYGSTAGSNISQTRTWSRNNWSWSGEGNTAPASGTIKWIKTKASPIRNEFITVQAATTTIGSSLTALRYNGSVWSADWTATTSSSTLTNTKIFGLAYEDLSGNAMVVYSDNTATPKYRYYTASDQTWGSEQPISVARTSGIVLFINMAVRPGTNELAFAYYDSKSDLNVLVWDGNAWGSEPASLLEGGVTRIDRQSFNLDYETASGNLDLFWGESATSGVFVAQKLAGQSSWSTSSSNTTGDAYNLDYADLIDVAADPSPTSNYIGIALMAVTSADLDAAVWDGTKFISKTFDLDGTTETQIAGAQMLQVGWVDGTAFFIYADSGETTVSWARWAPGSPIWILQTDVLGGMGDLRSAEILNSPDNTYAMVVNSRDHNNSATVHNLWAQVYDGIALSGTNGPDSPLETQLSTAVAFPYQPFSFAFARYTSVLTQNNYQWFNNANSVQPGSPLAGKNSSTSGMTSGTVIRMRTDIGVGVSDLAAFSQSFKIQYKTLGEGCSASGTWFDVGLINSASIWRGYNNSSRLDGDLISSALLNSGNSLETYEEQNPTAVNTNYIAASSSGEWDFVLQDNGAPENTTYCFRLSRSSGLPLAGYNNYPVLTTALEAPAPISISGKVYVDEGMTTTTANTVVALAVNNTKTSTTTITNGNYSFNNVIATSSSILTVYWDTDGGAKAVTVTKVATTSITDLDLYQNRVIVRHEGTSTITATDLDQYDSYNDSDILYTATTSPSIALAVNADAQLYIWPNKTFNPGGSVTISSGGSGDAWDGSIRLTSGSTFNASGSTHSIGGSWFASSTSSFTSGTSTITFTSTTTGKTITTNGKPFYNLTFNGTGTIWTILDNATTTNDLTISAGTVSSSYNMNVWGGDVSGDGALNFTSGTFLLDGTGYFGGTTPWSFNNLTFGDGSGTATTTATSTATTTITNVLKIASSQVLNAGQKPWVLSGGGTPFVINGTFNYETSTLRYTSSANTYITDTDYYNLEMANSSTSALAGYAYRKQISVSNATDTAQTNYQLKLIINKGSGTDSNSTVYLNNHALSWTGTSPDDVRFTKSDGTTLLDYWVESSNDATATAWIEFDSLPALSTSTFYIYYGKSLDASASNGSTTFAFFDHFPGSSLNTSIWQGDTGSGSVSGSILTYGGAGNKTIRGKTSFGVNYAMEAYAYFSPNTSGYHEDLGFGSGAWVPVDMTIFYCQSGSVNILNQYNSVLTAPGSNYATGTYKRQTLARNSTINTRFYENGIELSNSPLATNTPPTSLYPYIGAGHFSQDPPKILVDWIAVRKYISQEPSFNNWGTEEQNSFFTLATTTGKTINVNNNITINAGTVTAGTNNPALNVDGNLTINSASAFIAPTSSSFAVAGNWSNQGTFAHNSGTTTFDGSSTTTFSGATTFYNFNSVTPSKGLTFATGTSATTTVAGTLTLNGQASSTKISIASTQSGQYSYLNALGSTNVTYVNVKDNNATGSLNYIAAASSTDSGNNVKWWFNPINISGKVYVDEGMTTTTANTIVSLAVNSTKTSTTTITNGNYSFSNVPATSSSILTVYWDTNGGAKAVTVTKGATTSITDLDLYQNRVIVRHEGTSTITATDLDSYDSNNDSDILYTATTSPSIALTVNADAQLYIWPNKTFNPGGSVTISSGGSGDAWDGSIRLTSGSTFNASGSTHSIGGSWFASSTATFTSGTSTITFTSTSTGKTITTNGQPFYNLTFNGTGGIWTILDNATTTNDLTISAGTASSSYNMNVWGGDVSGDGTLNFTSGTFMLDGTGYFGGTAPWSFNSLTFGDGSGTATTTATSTVTATTTVNGNFTISSSQTLNGAKSFTVYGGNVSGNGTISLTSGTFFLDGTGYFGGTAPWSFNSLTFGDGSGTATTTATSTATTTITNVLKIASSQVLNAGQRPWVLSGGGTPFVINGTFNYGTSTFMYTSSANTYITDTDYYNLEMAPQFKCGGSVSFTYNGSTVTYGTVGSASSTCWLDRNLGATTTATAYNTPSAYGDLFQWGRLDDGHQTRTSASTTATSSSDVPGHSSFINTPDAPYDWRIPSNDNLWQGVSGTNNPCPSGWRLPTKNEWETERLSWSQNNYNGAFASPLKLTAAGYRNNIDAALGDVGNHGYYWSSATSVSNAYSLNFDSFDASTGVSDRAVGFSVRCLLDNLNTPTYTLATTTGKTINIHNNMTMGNGVDLTVTASTTNPIINVDGNLTINSTTTFVAPTSTFTVAGNWSNSGTFTHNNGTTTFDGSSTTTFSGATTFYNFNSITPSKGLTFATGTSATTTVAGTMTLNGGASGTRINLTTTQSGQYCYLNALASTSVNYVNVKDNNATGSANTITAYYSIDSSHNVKWYFPTMIDISGKVYVDEGMTTTTANTVVALAVNNTKTSTTTITNGNYSFNNVIATSSSILTVYWDTNGGAKAVTVTKGATTSITDLDLYQNRVIVRHEGTSTITATDLDQYDSNNDSDILYTATTSPSIALIVNADAQLYIWPNKIFNPGGSVTLSSGGSGDAWDGSIRLTSGSTFNASGSTHSIGGSWFASSTATFTSGTSTITFTSTSTSRLISGNLIATSSFYKVTFNGLNGAWTITDPMKVSAANASDTLVIKQGTVTVGDGNGDNLEVLGMFTVGDGTGNATLTTATLTQGNSLTIHINSTSTPSCPNCIIKVGDNTGSGTFNIKKNVILQFNSGASVQSGLGASSTGYIWIEGSQDATNTISSISEDSASTTLSVSGTPYSSNQHQNKNLRITSGFAFGKIYDINSNGTGSINVNATNSATDLAPDVIGESACLAASSSCTIYVADNLFTATRYEVGRYLYNITDNKYYQIIWNTEAATDTIKIFNNMPDDYTTMGDGDAIKIVDGIKANDTFEILDYAQITANTTNNGYIYAQEGSESLIRYADISEMGANTDVKYGLSFYNVNGANSNEGVNIEKSRIHDNSGYCIVLKNSDSSNSSYNKGFSNNSVYRNVNYGFYLSSSNNNTFSQNNVYGIGSLGFYILSSSTNNTLSQNNIYLMMNAGSSVQNSNNNTFSQNNIYGNNSGGIFFTSSNNNAFSQNNIFGNGSAGFGLSGSTNNTISQNNSYGNMNIGFSIISSSINNTFSQNNSYGNDTYGFSVVSSANNTFSQNNVYWNNTRGLNSQDSISMILIKENYSTNTVADIYFSDNTVRSTIIGYSCTLGSATTVGNVATSGAYVISYNHDGNSTSTRVWGEYAIPADDSDTPQNESINKFNYADNTWEDSIARVNWYDSTTTSATSSTKDTNLDFSFGTGFATTSALYRATCSSTTNIFNVYRNEVYIGNATTGVTFTDNLTKLSFKIDGSDYTQFDTYSFVAFASSSNANTQKVIEMMTDGDTFNIASGTTLQLTGQSSTTNLTAITRGGSSGGYTFNASGTLAARYFSFNYLGGTNGYNGLYLQSGASTTINDGYFDNFASSTQGYDSYMTVHTDLISTGTPQKTLSNMSFINTGNGADYNVKATGTAVSGYWNFANYLGTFAGEAYDKDATDTDPGEIRWTGVDDLQFSLNPGTVNLDLRLSNDFTDSYPIVLTATTSHPNGFIIKAHMADTLGRLTTTTAEIIRYPYDNASPKPWTQTCNASSTCCGFGYTTNDSSLTGGTADRFTNPTSYAGFATSSAAADPVATGGTGGESYTVTVKGSVASDQKAESYTGTIYFIATINY